MKNKYFFLVTILGALVALSIVGVRILDAGETANKKVVVVDFEVSANALSSIGTLGTEFSNFETPEKASSFLTSELFAALEKDLKESKQKGYSPDLKRIKRSDIGDIPKKGNGKSGEVPKLLVANFLEKGKSLGADYVVIGKIELIEVKKKKNKSKASGRKIDELFGHMVVNLRMIDVHAGKIIYADKVDQLEIECLEEESGIMGTVASLFEKRLVDAIVKQLAIRITETIWPIKISRVQEGYAYLDHGQDADLKLGMNVGVYIPTRPITDLDTGDILSDTEHLIAELKITEVLPKVAKTQIIKYSRPIEPGFICRTKVKAENKDCER